MSVVEFEEPKFSFDRKVPIPEVKSGPIIRIIIKTGVAKKTATVNAVMIGICLFCLILTAILVKVVVYRDNTVYIEDLTPEEIKSIPVDLLPPSKNAKK